MKKHFTLLSAATLLASSLAATPLQQSEIASDAKWLAHVDMEALLQSAFGDWGKEALKEAIAKSNDSKISIDLDVVLDEIKSVTAYGADIGPEAAASSVLILKTGERLQTIFQGYVAHQEMEEDSAVLKRIEGKSFESFILKDEIFIALPHPNYALVGRSYEQIERSYAVILGAAQNIEGTSEPLVLNSQQGFFLLASAKGIDTLKDIPPQARMLQKTKGGQLSIGEGGGELQANLILSTEGREVSRQLAQIVQGLLALASFTQVEDQSMTDIVDRVQVGQGESFVSLDFSYPVSEMLELIAMLSKDGEGSERHHFEQTAPAVSPEADLVND